MRTRGRYCASKKWAGHPALGGLQVDVGQGGADDELEQGLAALQQAGDALGPLLQAQVAGVEPVGLDGHEGLGGEEFALIGPVEGCRPPLHQPLNGLDVEEL